MKAAGPPNSPLGTIIVVSQKLYLLVLLKMVCMFTNITISNKITKYRYTTGFSFHKYPFCSVGGCDPFDTELCNRLYGIVEDFRMGTVFDPNSDAFLIYITALCPNA